jgi:hypothetical protein
LLKREVFSGPLISWDNWGLFHDFIQKLL